MKTLGQTLKDLRAALDLTQGEVAEAISMTQGMITKYEQDAGNPTLENLKKLAGYYEVKISDLLAGTAVIAPERRLDADRNRAIRLILAASGRTVAHVLKALDQLETPFDGSAGAGTQSTTGA